MVNVNVFFKERNRVKDFTLMWIMLQRNSINWQETLMQNQSINKFIN